MLGINVIRRTVVSDTDDSWFCWGDCAQDQFFDRVPFD